MNPNRLAVSKSSVTMVSENTNSNAGDIFGSNFTRLRAKSMTPASFGSFLGACVLILSRGMKDALPTLSRFRTSTHAVATLSSSTTMWDNLLPPAISIAVA